MAKSLKDQNNWKLWLIIAANALFFYGILISNHIGIDGLKAVFSQIKSLVPVGIAGIVATVINSLPSSTTKARIVYLRWNDTLPGHRAFSIYAPRDPRINMARLEKLFKGKIPASARDQNSEWYKLYRSVENDQRVYSVHRDFLLLRDYATLSVLFMMIFGAGGFFFFSTLNTAALYLLLLLIQFLVVRQAAANCGIRMVANVLAIKTSTGA
jgi:hypothetical protein